MAHPDASTRMVEQALLLAPLYDAFESRTGGADAQTFAREWRRFLGDAQGLL
jgi:hypothetical protein